MRKTAIVVGLLAVCLLGLTVRSGDGQAPAGKDDPAITKAIGQAVAAYAEVFNKGDLKALGAVWAEDAEYIDENGTVTKGRDAIAALFKQHLADMKGAKVAFKVTSVRPLTADIAMQDGVSIITRPDSSVDEGRFTAVWFKKDGKWLIRSARDLPYDAGETVGATGALKDLQWMIGTWEGEKGGVQVTVRWTLNRAFLSQEYTVKDPAGEMLVTQLVGFDPLSGEIKSWTFDSRGGYGEGLWTRDGNAWNVETVGVLPNGQTGSALNVIRFVDDNHVVFQARDREIGGQPIPDSEVKLVRSAVKK
jgi:uncharacterized protein (TIGR02246 family)